MSIRNPRSLQQPSRGLAARLHKFLVKIVKNLPQSSGESLDFEEGFFFQTREKHSKHRFDTMRVFRTSEIVSTLLW